MVQQMTHTWLQLPPMVQTPLKLFAGIIIVCGIMSLIEWLWDKDVKH